MIPWTCARNPAALPSNLFPARNTFSRNSSKQSRRRIYTTKSILADPWAKRPGDAELPCGDCPSSFRAAGSPEQAPSFYVLSIVVRRAGSTQVLAFFRVEGGLPETCQLLRQNQKAAIRQFPRADIKPACGLTNTKVSIFVFASPYV